ncbi:MAG: ATP-binding protein [Myxococcota bacterium]
MKEARPIQGALIGFSGGLAILVATLALEVYARGWPVQGGLLRLQLESVAVWVLESMPVLLAGAAYVVMMPADTPMELPVGRTRAGVRQQNEAKEAKNPAEPSSAPLALPGPTSAPLSSGQNPSGGLAQTSPVSAPNAAPVSGGLPTASNPPLFTPSTGGNAVTASPVSSGGGISAGAAVTTPLPPPPPVPDALRSANLLGQSGTDHRVRALQELVKALKETAAHASEESLAKSAMLTNLTEELRTPLSEIVGVAEMLAEETKNPSQTTAALETDLRKVAGAGRYLVRLINEILDLSRIEVGQLALVMEDVDLAQVMEEIRASMDVNSSSRLSTHLDPPARMARGDHMRVRQVLLALVRDATEASDGGPVTVTIETGKGNGIEIRVRDTGPPMTEAQIERLLQRHPSDLSRHPHERRGLGLAVGRRLAELMGGQLQGRSDGSRGCEFMLVLPAPRISADKVRPRSTIALNERLSGMHLVLADAEPASRPLASFLARAGLHVDHVGGVAEGRLASEKAPDLAVIDVGLTGGWDFVEDLLERKVRVVVTSLRDEDVEPALQRGVTAFLVRPVDRKLALATLERCLDD